ncbi:MAG: hypothetical protein COX70_06965 [Flavobacteriales bacterium CG_4_10_14_0_2_um_filter_32_8]|nr:MAG: hypothetical protein COX70_06965 [Flavobacteriales bacterium CG_4_10_14_0_2_um_filter_32_8]
MDYYLPRLEKQIVKIKNDSILLDAIKNEIKLTGEKLEVRILKEAELTIQREDKIHMIIEKIKLNKEWFESIKIKAAKQRISLDEMIEKDAEYILNQELN